VSAQELGTCGSCEGPGCEWCGHLGTICASCGYAVRAVGDDCECPAPITKQQAHAFIATLDVYPAHRHAQLVHDAVFGAQLVRARELKLGRNTTLVDEAIAVLLTRGGRDPRSATPSTREAA
jgi:hypothetical protein